eukprot:TRINITY_DN5268_c0_g1_i2.p1 TRINITY_DN5268_c0_g1~~TRINITY_DN5268_c0_g1_i2.p1  ORF type:complete len:174 (-),score=48.27 TRINITY_DN5268_c0_g1_i2:371-892(-)
MEYDMPPPVNGYQRKRLSVVPLSKLQAQKLRESCAQLEVSMEHHALILFLTIFELAPEARQLFWFVRDMDEPAPTNPVLQKHANKAFLMIMDCAKGMDDPEKIARMKKELISLAKKHRDYGVQADDFPVFRTALLKTMNKALNDKWAEVEEAWSAAFDILEEFLTAGLEGRDA